MKEMGFAEKIKMIRERKKLTGKDLGEMLRVGKSTIHNWETGKSEPREEEILNKVERLLEEVEDSSWERQEARRRMRDHLLGAIWGLMRSLEESYPEVISSKFDRERKEFVLRIKEWGHE